MTQMNLLGLILIDGNYFDDDKIELLIKNNKGELINKFDEFKKMMKIITLLM